jgi:hypothetical protein
MFPAHHELNALEAGRMLCRWRPYGHREPSIARGGATALIRGGPTGHLAPPRARSRDAAHPAVACKLDARVRPPPDSPRRAPCRESSRRRASSSSARLHRRSCLSSCPARSTEAPHPPNAPNAARSARPQAGTSVVSACLSRSLLACSRPKHGWRRARRSIPLSRCLSLRSQACLGASGVGEHSLRFGFLRRLLRG